MIQEKLKKLRTERKLTQLDVANQVRVSLTSYTNWERGTKTPSPKNIKKLAKCFEIQPYEFEITGELESELLHHFQHLGPARKNKVLKFTKQQRTEQEGKILSLQNERTFTKVKVYEGLSAGNGFGIIGDGKFDEVTTDESLPSYDIASWIRGDSMLPKYEDWSVALIKETGFDYDGAIYAVYVAETNSTYIKKVYVEKSGLRLVSLNNLYPDRFISSEDNPLVIGKVIGHFTPLEN